MEILGKAKEVFIPANVIVWECESCGETFETLLRGSSQAPSRITCQKCGAANLREITRKRA